MSHPARFYVTEITGDPVILDKSQSHHLVKVLRLKKGVAIELFDKAGNSYNAEVVSLGQTVHLKILGQIRDSQFAIRNSISLATAIPKGHRMDWLVGKCAELGLSKLIPIETKFSVTKEVGSNKIARWKKIAVESAKQSRQPQIMEITEILPFNKLFDSITKYDLKLLASPEGEPLSDIKLFHNGQILYCIGPEGGFSPDEVEKAKGAGFKTVSLPVGGILRVETAAIAMLGILKYLTVKSVSL